MIDVIRSEWIKFRSVRSTVVLLGVGAALVVLVGVIQAHSVADDRSGTGFPGHLGDVTAGIPLALFLFGALGVQVIGQEYRFNTIRPSFTAVPRRGLVLAGKAAVAAGAIAAVTLAMVAICAAIGAVTFTNFEIDGLDQRIILGTVLFAVGWTLMGMGVGCIVRQPIAGILILLAEAFVVENLLGGLVPKSRPWLPFTNGVQMTFRGENGGEFRSVLGGGIYFFVVVAVVWAVGAYLVTKRDA